MSRLLARPRSSRFGRGDGLYGMRHNCFRISNWGLRQGEARGNATKGRCQRAAGREVPPPDCRTAADHAAALRLRISSRVASPRSTARMARRIWSSAIISSEGNSPRIIALSRVRSSAEMPTRSAAVAQAAYFAPLTAQAENFYRRVAHLDVNLVDESPSASVHQMRKFPIFRQASPKVNRCAPPLGQPVVYISADHRAVEIDPRSHDLAACGTIHRGDEPRDSRWGESGGTLLPELLFAILPIPMPRQPRLEAPGVLMVPARNRDQNQGSAGFGPAHTHRRIPAAAFLP